MTIHDLVKQYVRAEANDWVMPLIWGLTRIKEGMVYGEIGFKRGSSALAALIAAREVGGRVYAMDIDPCYEGLDRVKAEGYLDLLTFIHGDSAAAEFPELLDILFIDGSHEYLDVATDYEKHHSSVKPGGLILFHDPCSCPGVRKFLEEREIPIMEIVAGLGVLKTPDE